MDADIYFHSLIFPWRNEWLCGWLFFNNCCIKRIIYAALLVFVFVTKDRRSGFVYIHKILQTLDFFSWIILNFFIWNVRLAFESSRRIIRTKYFNFCYEINTNLKKNVSFVRFLRLFLSQTLLTFLYLQFPFSKRDVLLSVFWIFFKETIVYTPFTHTLSLKTCRKCTFTAGFSNCLVIQRDSLG